MREGIDVLELDHASGQQAQGPTPALVGRGGAGQRDQLGFLFTIELALIEALADPVRAERGVQALLDEALPQALHGSDADVQRHDDPLIRPGRATLGLVSLEQDLRMLQLADVGLATGEQPFQLVALGRGQRHSVLLHRPPPVGPRQTNRPASHQIIPDAALDAWECLRGC